MDDFSLGPGVPDAFGLVAGSGNRLAPGKRPLSSMSPTIVVGDDGVEMVLGAAGGPMIISSTVEVLLDALLFGMDAQAAEAAPRVHHQRGSPGQDWQGQSRDSSQGGPGGCGRAPFGGRTGGILKATGSR